MKINNTNFNQIRDLNQMIFLSKKSFDLNCDLNQRLNH